MMVQQGTYIGRAPGRLDVMGGIADYSGSLLLQMPIGLQTEVSLQVGEQSDWIRIRSSQENEVFEMHVSEISGIPYRELGGSIRNKTGGTWAAYVVGCFAVLNQEKDQPLFGADIHVNSNVPMGKGVSSSAALEVATMHAICRATGLRLDPIELSVLAQKVENLVVGAACGLMDQLSVNLGRKDRLLPIVCQPHEVDTPIDIPEGLSFYGLDSGVRHAVSGASYGDVRTAAFMAFTVAMFRAGISLEQLQSKANLPYSGKWANISLATFQNEFAPLIPKKMRGGEFLEAYGVHIDEVTKVDPHVEYDLLAAALHPVAENDRVSRFRQMLEEYPHAPDPASHAATIGELMFGSHHGYGSVGLGEPVTDRIVELVRASTDKGVLGARISGGGSGGTVSILVRGEEGIKTVRKIHEMMERETGKSLVLFEGSSEGAHFIN